jgi:hypothetical protein
MQACDEGTESRFCGGGKLVYGFSCFGLRSCRAGTMSLSSSLGRANTGSDEAANTARAMMFCWLLCPTSFMWVVTEWLQARGRTRSSGSMPTMVLFRMRW